MTDSSCSPPPARPDTSEAFFERKYRRGRDPWGFAERPYERERFHRMERALADRSFRAAFEPACSEGEFTARLSSRCDTVDALDISETAVSRARRRCQDLSNVRIRAGRLPEDMLPGPFDLIVLSECGYYFEAPVLRRLARDLGQASCSIGLVLACHWTGYSGDHVMSGRAVHRRLAEGFEAAPASSRHFGDEDHGFEIACWEMRDVHRR